MLQAITLLVETNASATMPPRNSGLMDPKKMTLHSQDNFSIGGCRVLPEQNKIETPTGEIQLQPKVMAVFCYLVEHQGRVVSIEELIEELWDGTVVSNHSVQRCISEIRKSLKKCFGDGDFVRSFSKKGYQLVLPKPVRHDSQSDDNLSETKQSSPITKPPTLETHVSSPELVRLRRPLSAIVAGIVAIYFGFYLWHNNFAAKPVITTAVFDTLSLVTSEPGLEMYPEPHPNEEHLAFVKRRQAEFELVIRDKLGQDWVIDESQGRWDLLCWSPDGGRLVAAAINDTNSGQKLDVFLFTLDVNNKRILEKKQLMHWQGSISSITWRDNQNLALTARHDPISPSQLFSYHIKTGGLEKIETDNVQKHPHMIDIDKGRAVLASYHQGQIMIDFFAEDKTLIASHKLDSPWVDISWIPGQDKVLILNVQKIMTLDIDGNIEEIVFTSEQAIHRPRYSAANDGIYLTRIPANADIVEVDLDGEYHRLTDHFQMDYLGMYSRDGKRVFYLAKRGTAFQLRVITDGRDQELTGTSSKQMIDYFIPSDDGNFILYRVGDTLKRYNLSSGEADTILKSSDQYLPIAYFPEKDLLFYGRAEEDNANLWQKHLGSGVSKQLTFGTVNSAVAIANKLYFQYYNQPGLYVLGFNEKIPQLVSTKLPPNAQFFMVDEKGAHYYTVDYMQQSDLHYLDFEKNETTVFLPLKKNQSFVTSVHPDRGVLLTTDPGKEGDIILLKKSL